MQNLLICSNVDGHLRCCSFGILQVMFLQIFLRTSLSGGVCVLPGKIPKTGVSGKWGIYVFSLGRNCQFYQVAFVLPLVMSEMDLVSQTL